MVLDGGMPLGTVDVSSYSGEVGRGEGRGQCNVTYGWFSRGYESIVKANMHQA